MELFVCVTLLSLVVVQTGAAVPSKRAADGFMDRIVRAHGGYLKNTAHYSLPRIIRAHKGYMAKAAFDSLPRLGKRLPEDNEKHLDNIYEDRLIDGRDTRAYLQLQSAHGSLPRMGKKEDENVGDLLLGNAYANTDDLHRFLRSRGLYLQGQAQYGLPRMGRSVDKLKTYEENKYQHNLANLMGKKEDDDDDSSYNNKKNMAM